MNINAHIIDIGKWSEAVAIAQITAGDIVQEGHTTELSAFLVASLDDLGTKGFRRFMKRHTIQSFHGLSSVRVFSKDNLRVSPFFMSARCRGP